MAALVKSAGLAADTTAQIEALFRDYSPVNGPGASVMVIRDGKPIFAKGFGLADLERKIHCTPNTAFRLASVSKQFTAMAILILAERGALSLDEKLTDFFPEFPAYGRQITVRHLLTHTSGLLDYEDEIPTGTTLPVLDRDVLRILLERTGDAPGAGVHAVAWTENAAQNAARLTSELAEKNQSTSRSKPTTYFPPGTKFRYSNTGYSLLALIVEVRSGETFAGFLKKNIFEPLKMTNTLAYERGSSVVPNRAFGHTPRDGKFVRTDQSLTSSVLGDGGIYSSVVDLAKWDAALYGKKLVSEPMLRVAFSPAVETDKPGRSYGFGWYIGEYRGLREIWHSGDTIGFRTRIARFPEKKFTVIILANRADAELEELPHKIADLVLFVPESD